MPCAGLVGARDRYGLADQSSRRWIGRWGHIDSDPHLKEVGMSNSHEYESSEVEYQVRFRENEEPSKVTHRRQSSTRRRNGSPQSFNGIHRRRRKKFSW